MTLEQERLGSSRDETRRTHGLLQPVRTERAER